MGKNSAKIQRLNAAKAKLRTYQTNMSAQERKLESIKSYYQDSFKGNRRDQFNKKVEAVKTSTHVLTTNIGDAITKIETRIRLLELDNH